MINLDFYLRKAQALGVKKSAQIPLFKFNSDTAFGGDRRGNAKTARPLCSKRVVHLIMKSKLAKGRHSMRDQENESKVRRILSKNAKRFGVKICDLAVLGNHFHAVIRITRRDQFKNFLRAIAGLIPRALISNKDRKDGQGFWEGKAYTRVVEWGRAYEILQTYILKNQFEAYGYATHKAEKLADEEASRRRRDPFRI